MSYCVRFSSIYEVLVTKSADFAGRSSTYLTDLIQQGSKGSFLLDVDGQKVRRRRKLLHSYLRQYGAGMKRIEQITMDTTADMIKELMGYNGQPVNIKPLIFRCVSNIMGIMLIGDELGDEVHELAQVAISRSLGTAYAKSFSAEIVNRFSFMRFFGNHAYNSVIKTVEMREQLLQKWMAYQSDKGFVNFIKDLPEEQKIMHHISETREQHLALHGVYIAGVGTTSTSLTILMNVLCQRPDVQQKLQKELKDVIGDSRPPTLADRDLMPYHMATLLEISRYASVAPFGLLHKTVCDTTLESTGKSIHVPAGTEVITHL